MPACQLRLRRDNKNLKRGHRNVASEYLKWKYRDVKPDEPPPPRTRKQRLANWFYYYKWWIVVWVVLLGIIGSIVWNALGIGQTKPDYIFAYIGSTELPESCTASLKAEIAKLGQDVNGDGKVTVELRQYIIGRGGDPETAMYYDYADQVLLMADLGEAESYFFLAEDASAVQKAYQIFARADGTPPEEGDVSVQDKVYPWSGCPVLSGLAVEQSLLEGLSFGRRCFYDEKQAKEREAAAALWEVLTEGAHHQ